MIVSESNVRISIHTADCDDLAAANGVAGMCEARILRIIWHTYPVEGWEGEDIDSIVLDSV